MIHVHRHSYTSGMNVSAIEMSAFTRARPDAWGGAQTTIIHYHPYKETCLFTGDLPEGFLETYELDARHRLISQSSIARHREEQERI